MDPDVLRRLRRQATAEGETPERCVQDAVAQALARDRSTRRARLDCSLSFFELATDQVTVHEAQRARPSSR
ncbi:hypothetical protein [Streptomyces lacrimifluminis]|uniref:hypothetical protein n=1 Tax=Streptomyces lacrimifluminis TaxID=1500077 RepID=UPI0031EF8450